MCMWFKCPSKINKNTETRFQGKERTLETRMQKKKKQNKKTPPGIRSFACTMISKSSLRELYWISVFNKLFIIITVVSNSVHKVYYSQSYVNSCFILALDSKPLLGRGLYLCSTSWWCLHKYLVWSFIWSNSYLYCGCRWKWGAIIAVNFPI